MLPREKRRESMKEGKERQGGGKGGGEREEKRGRKGEGVCVTWCWLQFIVVGFLDHFNHVTLGAWQDHVTSIPRSCDINTKVM